MNPLLFDELPEDITKALTDPEKGEEEEQKTEPKSAIIDPTNGVGIMGVRQKPTPVPFTTLRRMAQIPAISAIINTRLNQVARYAKRPRFDGDTGFKIVLKDREKKMTGEQKKRAFEIEEFFRNTGAVKSRVRKDNFNQFLRKVVRDSLTIDVLSWENVPNHLGGLSEIWAVDGATLEIVTDAPTGELDVPPVYIPVTNRVQQSSEDIAYVQKVNGQVTAEYTEDELAYGIRNPRTDLDYMGFGMSELEVLIEIITGIVNGIKYNTGYFNQSQLPQGVLEIVGNYKDEHLEAFKRHWRTLMNGAEGKWAVPILALQDGQGFKFTPFKNSNRDMEFNEFLEFLFNIACAVYQIDPNEVGFKSWTSSNSMSQSDNTAEKLEQSKDKGFIPLMNFLSDTFNSEIVDQIDDNFEFAWVGVDEQDEAQKWEHIKAKLDAGVVTVAEVRKQEDLPEILGADGKPEPWTLAPANPQLIQVFMNALQMQQQSQQAQLQDQNAQNDHDRQMEQAGQVHEQQLAQMDKQHALGMNAKMFDQDHDQNMKQSDQEHQQNMAKMQANEQNNTEKLKANNQMNMEKFKAKNAPKTQAKGNMKKSMIDEKSLPDVPFDWEDY